MNCCFILLVVVQPKLCHIYVYSASDFDAQFSSLEGFPLTESRRLYRGDSYVHSLSITIRNDVIPEEEECFSIQINPAEFGLFTCNRDGTNSTNYYCDHTICIEDDDGKV